MAMNNDRSIQYQRGLTKIIENLKAIAELGFAISMAIGGNRIEHAKNAAQVLITYAKRLHEVIVEMEKCIQPEQK